MTRLVTVGGWEYYATSHYVSPACWRELVLGACQLPASGKTLGKKSHEFASETPIFFNLGTLYVTAVLSLSTMIVTEAAHARSSLWLKPTRTWTTSCKYHLDNNCTKGHGREATHENYFTSIRYQGTARIQIMRKIT
jgi:hypothetical protein